MHDKENEKKYNCATCPYPRYNDGHIIFCDVCIRDYTDKDSYNHCEVQ